MSVTKLLCYHVTMRIEPSLVENFEAGAIDNSTFGHANHVYVIWSLIQTHGTLEAIRRFETSLKKITIAVGHPEKYNATITYCLGFLTAERIADHPSLGWDEFAKRNQDLLEWPNERLTRLYPDGVLHTERARQMFVLPGADPHS